MSTPLLDVRDEPGLREGLRQAVLVLRAGGLVAFPTETVYGLGANALDPAAVRRIFAAKGRPATNPVIVHLADAGRIHQVAAEWPGSAARLAARFWPGPLTLVLARQPELPDVVTAGGPTVAVRVPAHPVALALLAAVNLPIAAPSANRSNQLSPTRAEHVFRDLDGRVDLILDGGPTPGGLESTVLDLSGPPRLLRPGLIEPADLEAIIGPVIRQAPATVDSGTTLPSPGMLARHYAPRTSLETTEGNADERLGALATMGARIALVTRRDDHDIRLPTFVARLPADPAGYSRALYATLHDLDDGRFDRILVELPPAEEVWLAVRDRLRRAAASGE